MVTRIVNVNVNANANVSETETETETGTESAIVTHTATRDGTTNEIGTVNGIGIVVIVIVIGTGIFAALGTITVWTTMTRTPVTMDIWSGTKNETETTVLPSILATSEMGGTTDVGLGEIMRMDVGTMRRRPMETKMKKEIRVGKNAKEAEMWDAIYRNMKTKGIVRGLRRYVNVCFGEPLLNFCKASKIRPRS